MPCSVSRSAYIGDDLNNKTLRTEHIDNGVRRVVLDAAGNEVERRDAKGAVILRAFDHVHRPTRLWAVDATGSGGNDWTDRHLAGTAGLRG